MFEVISIKFWYFWSTMDIGRLWTNIFDTDISRCINTYNKVVYLAFFGIFMLLHMSVLKILASNMIYIVVFGVGLKCPLEIYLNTQCLPWNSLEYQWCEKYRYEHKVPDTTKLTPANVPPVTIRCKGFVNMPNLAKTG